MEADFFKKVDVNQHQKKTLFLSLYVPVCEIPQSKEVINS
jgi:hypothetical protein